MATRLLWCRLLGWAAELLVITIVCFVWEGLGSVGLVGELLWLFIRGLTEREPSH